jgi:hypothetical protein
VRNLIAGEATNSTISNLAMRCRKGELALVLLLTAPLLKATDLKPETLQAWDAYVHQEQAQTDQRVTGQAPFLWVDNNPELAKRVRAGEVVAEPEGGASPHSVPHGLIHHWIGAVFIPNASLDDVVSMLNEYGRYKDYYRPMVAESRLVEEAPNRELVRLLMVQKAFSVTAAVEADDEIQTVKLNADRAYIVSTSRSVREIADYGKSTEHALPEDQGPGYVWRTLTVTRVEQRDGGTYAEIEMIALSRGIPWAFRWLMQPLAERLPRNTMAAMLQDTREAVSLSVLARNGPPGDAQVAESLAERQQARASQ